MGTLIRDIRYAVRTLVRAPGFTLLVVATLGVGIGTNTAVFSVIDAVLLQRLPYPEPERLVGVWREVSGGPGPARVGLDAASFRELRDEPRLFEATAAWRVWEPTLTGVDEPEVLRAAEVSHAMFSGVLRVRPVLGRDFLGADDVAGGPDVVILSHRTWRSRFGGDPDVVGRSLSLSDVPYTVIGVMPEGFRPPFSPDAEVWRPRPARDDESCGRGCSGLRVIARLEPGVSLQQAKAHAATLAARLSGSFPAGEADTRLGIVALRDELSGRSGRPLWALQVAVALALLIACANVAHLLLARGVGRRREIALRMALGAERGPVMAQLLVESLVLAALAGIVGLGLAAWGTDALLSLAPEGAAPRLDGVGIDAGVLTFTALVTAATAVLFGLPPAWHAARRDPRAWLRQPAHRRTRPAPGGLLVAGQVGLTVALTVGAGLLLRSFRHLDEVDLGIRAEGVLAFDVALPRSRYADAAARRSFYAALLQRVAGLPTVRSAGAARSLPLAGDDEPADVRVEDVAPGTMGERRAARLRPVTPGYLEAVGLSLLAGRAFGPGDDAGSPRVAIVNRTLARRWFPEEEALGRRLAVDTGGLPEWRTIVGVVPDVRHGGIREPPVPAVYLPYGQVSPGGMSVVVRSDGEPLALADGVRRAVSGLDPSLAAARVRPLQESVDRALAPDRFVAAVLSAFAALALFLSGVGVYAVVSSAVTRRTRELGIRLALGAEAPAVRRLVLAGTLRGVASGLVLGVLGSLALGRIMSGLLYRVSPTDPLTLSAAVGLLAGAVALAAWLRASRLRSADPLAVLRETASRTGS